MDSSFLIPLITAAGGGAILLELFKSVLQWATGKSKREHDAWTQRDMEARKRRLLEEYAHILRYELINAGVPPESIAPWPPYRNNPPERADSPS